MLDEINESDTYLAYWDMLGFEYVVNVTKLMEERVLAKLSDEEVPSQVPLTALKLRALFNGHRAPEIWLFRADKGLSEDEIRQFSIDNPQYLVDFIRKNGDCLYKTSRSNQVIV